MFRLNHNSDIAVVVCTDVELWNDILTYAKLPNKSIYAKTNRPHKTQGFLSWTNSAWWNLTNTKRQDQASEISV